jgi:hypothetical protein
MELGRSPFGHAFVEPAPASPPSPVSDPASAAVGGLELLAPQALRHTSAPYTHDALTRQAARDITEWFRLEMSKREAGSRSGS